jgi:hypothetical protein
VEAGPGTGAPHRSHDADTRPADMVTACPDRRVLAIGFRLKLNGAHTHDRFGGLPGAVFGGAGHPGEVPVGAHGEEVSWVIVGHGKAVYIEALVGPTSEKIAEGV